MSAARVPPASDHAAGGRGGRPVGEYADLVLDLVGRIPPGRVVSYGDIAELLGQGGPRQVARVMAVWGGAVPWWRVLRADGTHVQRLRREAFSRLRSEEVPMRPGGDRVDMVAAHWDGS